MHSHHSHSGAFCCHAATGTTPWSMVEKANSLGFTHYALSEHVPRSSSASLYPEEIESNIGPKELLATFMNYLSEARKCSEYWENKSGKRIQVLVGAETENVDGRNYNTLDFLDQVLRDDKGWKVEYLVGSVHHVQSVPIDFDKETFNKALEQFMEPHCDTNENESYRTIAAHLKLMCGYLDAQLSVMERFQPEIIGHFDLCRLFLPQTPMTLAGRHRVSDDQHTQTLLEAVDKRVRRNIDFAIEYGALFELNSASVRKGWSTPYPGSDILEIISERGGRLCLSDDAHSHEQVGLNYHVTKKYLRDHGINEIWHLQRSDTGTQNGIYGRSTTPSRTSVDELDAFCHSEA